MALSRSHLCRLSCPSRNGGASTVTFWPIIVPVEERRGVHGHVCADYRARGGTLGYSVVRLLRFPCLWSMVGCPRSRLCRLSCPLRNEGASLVTLLPYSVPVEERRAVIGHVLAVFRAHRGTRGRRWLRFGRLSYPSRNEGPSSVTFWPFFVPVEERGGVVGHVCAVYRTHRGTSGRKVAGKLLSAGGLGAAIVLGSNQLIHGFFLKGEGIGN